MPNRAWCDCHDFIYRDIKLIIIGYCREIYTGISNPYGTSPFTEISAFSEKWEIIAIYLEIYYIKHIIKMVLYLGQTKQFLGFNQPLKTHLLVILGTLFCVYLVGYIIIKYQSTDWIPSPIEDILCKVFHFRALFKHLQSLSREYTVNFTTPWTLNK